MLIERGLRLGLPGLIAGGLFAYIAVTLLRDGFVSSVVSPAIVTIGAVGGLATLIVAASLGPSQQARRTQPASLLRED
jgi:ABC-type antimicrobial peptide transport system permease subunit